MRIACSATCSSSSGQNHNATRGGEFGAYGERKRFDISCST
jgi:hypothetical protein